MSDVTFKHYMTFKNCFKGVGDHHGPYSYYDTQQQKQWREENPDVYFRCLEQLAHLDSFSGEHINIKDELFCDQCLSIVCLKDVYLHKETGDILCASSHCEGTGRNLQHLSSDTDFYQSLKNEKYINIKLLKDWRLSLRGIRRQHYNQKYDLKRATVKEQQWSDYWDSHSHKSLNFQYLYEPISPNEWRRRSDDEIVMLKKEMANREAKKEKETNLLTGPINPDIVVDQFEEWGMCLFKEYLDLHNVPSSKTSHGYLHMLRQQACKKVQDDIDSLLAIVEDGSEVSDFNNLDTTNLTMKIFFKFGYHVNERYDYEQHMNQKSKDCGRSFTVKFESLEQCCDKIIKEINEYSIQSIKRDHIIAHAPYIASMFEKKSNTTNNDKHDDGWDDDWDIDSNSSGGNDQYSQAELDNHSNQMNPNNDAYHSSRR